MTPASAQTRIALYYAPAANSAWWQAGCRWLGRDAESGATLPQPQPDALARPLAELTQSPRRYGWHGTLVPPFRLAVGIDAEAVMHAAAAWAAEQAPFTLAVTPAQLGNFIAVRPDTSDGEAALRELEASALRTLHPLRAPITPTDLERRLAAPLTERQRVLLREWGYPYVFDEFRFHMTLSDSIGDASERTTLLDWWQHEAPALGLLRVDGAALFIEPAPGEPFSLWRRLPFGTTDAGDEASRNASTSPESR